MNDARLQLEEEGAVTLGYNTDLYALLRAIDEAMPRDAVLAIEGTHIAAEVRQFLLEREPAQKPELVANTIWPTSEVFHLPLSGSNLEELRDLAENFAEPEVGDHLMVYRGGDVLLWAHDASDGFVRLAATVPREAVEALRSALGPTLRKSKWRRG